MEMNRNCGCDMMGNVSNAMRNIPNVMDNMPCDHMADCRDNMTDKSYLGNMAIAMAYVPWQHFSKTYEPARGLRAGTIFPELDKPFYGRKGGRR